MKWLTNKLNLQANNIYLLHNILIPTQDNIDLPIKKLNSTHKDSSFR